MTSPNICGAGWIRVPIVQADDVDLVLVDQFPVGDRGVAAGQAVDDDPAGDPLGCGQAGVEGGAADRLQHQVVGQPQDLGGDVAAAGVDDVVGAQRPYHLMLAPGEAVAITVAP
jgi:hypothetical protein